ncbi:hypothetical protein ACFQ9X_25655 [Catenulispora yoronensis]
MTSSTTGPGSGRAALAPGVSGVVGGQDLLASGTWLAADPPAVRAATVLNGWGVLAPQSARLSRGDLALRFAAGGAEAVADLPLARYDPFLLVCATVEEVFLLSWDGRRPARRVLGPGLHLVVNSGLEGADSDEGPGVEQMAARIKYFRPQLAAAPRPSRWAACRRGRRGARGCRWSTAPAWTPPTSAHCWCGGRWASGRGAPRRCRWWVCAATGCGTTSTPSPGTRTGGRPSSTTDG